MFSRAVFIKSAASLFVASAAPSPSPLPNAWDLCDKSGALPYDRPLELKMRVLDGPDFDLLQYRGYPVWLHVFATWCGPCEKEMPAVVEASQTYQARGLRVIGIDVSESDNTVRAYRKRFGIPFPIAMDERGSFSYALERGNSSGNVEFPVSFFVTSDGYLYCENIGRMRDDELTYRVEHFLKDSPPSVKANGT